jgi:hypothetical protein
MQIALIRCSRTKKNKKNQKKKVGSKPIATTTSSALMKEDVSIPPQQVRMIISHIFYCSFYLL